MDTRITVVPLTFYCAVLIAVSVAALSGCAAAPQYTTRQCLIQLIGQTAPGQVAAQLVCEKEEPFAPEEVK